MTSDSKITVCCFVTDTPYTESPLRLTAGTIKFACVSDLCSCQKCHFADAKSHYIYFIIIMEINILIKANVERKCAIRGNTVLCRKIKGKHCHNFEDIHLCWRSAVCRPLKLRAPQFLWCLQFIVHDILSSKFSRPAQLEKLAWLSSWRFCLWTISYLKLAGKHICFFVLTVPAAALPPQKTHKWLFDVHNQLDTSRKTGIWWPGAHHSTAYWRKAVELQLKLLYGTC